MIVTRNLAIILLGLFILNEAQAQKLSVDIPTRGIADPPTASDNYILIQGGAVKRVRGTSLLYAPNNLSDLPSASTARTNLGLNGSFTLAGVPSFSNALSGTQNRCLGLSSGNALVASIGACGTGGGGGSGDVVGPASAVNNRLAVFDATTGKLIKDSGILYTAIPNENVLPVTMAAGTTASLTGPRQYHVCQGACTITPPVPVPGYEFCVLNNNNTSTAITLAALGSGAQYENTARTAYGTAGTGTLVSSGAIGDKICIVALNSTHYLTVSYVGTWVAN